MRFLIALAFAVVVTFFVFWIGAWLAGTVETPYHELNDFTVGEKMMLCNRVVDTRHQVSGYDYDIWDGNRCEHLSNLEECILDCLSRAGTIPIGAACYKHCVKKTTRLKPAE